MRATADWWLIQYAADLERLEPRNVGLVIDTPEGWRAQFLAESDDGRVDGRALKGLHLRRAPFEEWISYYRRRIADGDWTVAATLAERRPSNFSVRHGGRIIEDVRDWDHRFREMFARLVDPGSTRAKNQPMKRAIKRILRQANIEPTERTAVRAQYGPNAAPVQIEYPYAIGTVSST